MELEAYLTTMVHRRGGFVSEDDFTHGFLLDEENLVLGDVTIEVIDEAMCEDEQERIISLIVEYMDEGISRRRWVTAVRGFSGAYFILSGPMSSKQSVNDLPEEGK